MDTTTHHDLPELFAQLGLPNSQAEIDRFVRQHRPLPQSLNLSEAPFWNAGQAAFLREQWHQDDGDWVMQIDQLNTMLREHPQPEALTQGQAAPGAA